MKIGILTFHWATNYGAVLQCYALQEYLHDRGHDVEIINYKPWHFDFWAKYVRRPWLLKDFRKDLIVRKKESKLVLFRSKYLNMTKRYYSAEEMNKAQLHYDIVISGSDQVLNSSFTLYGENKPTSAYYLQAFPKSQRIGYAISFGCNNYPQEALSYAKKWINNFDKIGVREITGLSILDQMGYKGIKTLVPDPTILYGTKLFNDINIDYYPSAKNYLCVYILRKHIEIKKEHVIYVDDYNNPLSMEQWLGTIIGSKGLLTNSYHGMIIAILNHIPFVVLADAANMNDRFNTLLSRINLKERIVTDARDYESVMAIPIDWNIVENKISEYREKGVKFLCF